jgi:hypothetical protein
LDDFEAIRQLTARYNRTFDEREVDAWVDCFLPEGEMYFVNEGRSIIGHTALREVISTSSNTGRHVVTDFEIELHGQRARQRCHLTELGVDDRAVVRRYGRYEDELVKTSDGWRFHSRRLRYSTGGST